MIHFIQNLFLTNRFFYSIGILIVTFILAYFLPFLLYVGHFLGGALIVLCLTDMFFLYAKKNGVQAERIVPDKLSNSDKNPIILRIHNNYSFKIHTEIIDELPFQFQIRDFLKKCTINTATQEEIHYTVTPKERGIYSFGAINIFVSTAFLGIIQRRFPIETPTHQQIPCYPSYIQLKKYSLMAFSQTLVEGGLKRIRKMGSSSEFEKINFYIKGDDIRHINWKASAKRDVLMVNKYVEEKSQTIYSIVDTGRSMRMPFNGLTLLDYSINAALVASNIAIKKEDKVGVAAFSTSLTNLVVADRRNQQMQLILEALYAVKTEYKETDFGRLYSYLKQKITQRSLLLIYTNFETLDSLNRQLKYLKAINRNHLVVIIMFKNTELEELATSEAKNKQAIYDKTIADNFIFNKKLIIKELNKHGILTVYTDPKDLIINTINKYLEIKAKNML